MADPVSDLVDPTDEEIEKTYSVQKGIKRISQHKYLECTAKLEKQKEY